MAKLAVPLKSVIASKQFGFEDFLAPLVAQACIAVMPEGRNAVNVDNVRVSKLIGRTIYDSQVVKGLVVERDSLGSVKHVTGAKIAVFGCGIEAGSTETKGNVVLNNAADLKSYTQGEEKNMEDVIASVAATGANVVIASGAIRYAARRLRVRARVYTRNGSLTCALAIPQRNRDALPGEVQPDGAEDLVKV